MRQIIRKNATDLIGSHSFCTLFNFSFLRERDSRAGVFYGKKERASGPAPASDSKIPEESAVQAVTVNAAALTRPWLSLFLSMACQAPAALVSTETVDKKETV